MTTMNPPRVITLEEHAVFPALGHDQPAYNLMYKSFPGVVERLQNHTARIADMNAGHVDIQILSQLSGLANWRDAAACRLANDQLIELIASTPGGRFGGWAALYMGDPAEAAGELERAVGMGLVGAMIDSHLVDGRHYDDPMFWPVFEVAERLGVPLYIHPAPVAREDEKRFEGGYDERATLGVATGAWGWHEDVGLGVVKMFAAGVFDRFPGLQIVLGHFGELVPGMVDRIDKGPFFKGARKFSEVWDENVWVTTSGVGSVRSLEMVLAVTRVERVLYSVDTPFISSVVGWKWVEEVREKGVLSEEEMEGLLGGNARRLLKM